jgi:hypothetical protein
LRKEAVQVEKLDTSPHKGNFRYRIVNAENTEEEKIGQFANKYGTYST